MSEPSMWMEIEIEGHAAEVRVAARTSRDEKAPPRMLGPEMSTERLVTFGKRVAEAARQGQPLGALADEARAIRYAIMNGRLDQLRSELHGAADGRPVLVRFMVMSTELQLVPWEAICDPDEANGFWGISPDYMVTRGVMDARSSRIWHVRGALNVLVVAPLGGASIDRVQQALKPRIDSQEIAWLPPIGPEQASLSYLLDRLSMEPAPHVIHFVGHGGVRDGKPVLQLANDPAGDPTWLDVELLGMQLRATRGTVRMVILEACEGAKPGDFASAAEALSRQGGVEAVVAHLWPVHADLARKCSERFYSALVGDRRRRGDAAAALNDTRLKLFTLNAGTAETFSPVLYLRSNDSRLFEFTSEDSVDAGVGAVPSELEKIVDWIHLFTLVLGDLWQHDRAAFESFKEKLRAELSHLPPGLPSSALLERAALEFGAGVLETKFQEIFKQVTRPKFIDGIARVLPPGAHITLLRTPLLEQAVEEIKPGTTLYVVQPGKDRPAIRWRKANSKGWESLTRLPTSFDPAKEILILRLYCGYMPDQIFTPPLLTEDHYLLNNSGIEEALYGRGRTGPIAETVLSELNRRPALLMGLSIFAWNHRKLLNDVFKGKQLPTGSLALVDPEREDPGFWERGAGLPGGIGVATVSGTADDLDRWLEEIAAVRGTRGR